MENSQNNKFFPNSSMGGSTLSSLFQRKVWLVKINEWVEQEAMAASVFWMARKSAASRIWDVSPSSLKEEKGLINW